MITKTVQKEDIYFIQFTDEEMAELGMKPHDKFEVIMNPDNSIMLKKFASIEIDLSEFSREILEDLISRSIDEQVPVDEIIRQALEKLLEANPEPVAAKKKKPVKKP